MPVDTIYAVSSGRPPAAIAVLRISGPGAGTILTALAGGPPEPRVATLRTIRSASGELLDRALVLWFPGPASATGEDVAELHVHGGIAVVRAVSDAVGAAGARLAEPGEFTRRALLNGRIDLTEAEGLADLLAAETESQRREAMLRASGALARRLDDWGARLLEIAAEVERAIDFDEDDVAAARLDVATPLIALRDDIATALRRPSPERLRDGVRVAIVGPANAGKSSLFNALLGSEAAIVAAVAGTTRDAIERPVTFGGIAFVLIDTAGERDTGDTVERIGIDRARLIRETADIVVDLGSERAVDARYVAVAAKSDIRAPVPDRLSVSAVNGSGLDDLIAALIDRASAMLPAVDEAAFNRRSRSELTELVAILADAVDEADLILVAEHLSAARRAFDRLTGRAGVEDMLDTLFARFCLGK